MHCFLELVPCCGPVSLQQEATAVVDIMTACTARGADPEMRLKMLQLARQLLSAGNVGSDGTTR